MFRGRAREMVVRYRSYLRAALTVLIGGIATRDRSPAWNDKALVVVWSEAGETVQITGRDMKHAGFSLVFALQNNTTRDITIPTDAAIMKRLKKGRTLTEYSGVKLGQSFFVPAHQSAQLSIWLDRGCAMKIWRPGAVSHVTREPASMRSSQTARRDGALRPSTTDTNQLSQTRAKVTSAANLKNRDAASLRETRAEATVSSRNDKGGTSATGTRKRNRSSSSFSCSRRCTEARSGGCRRRRLCNRRCLLLLPMEKH